LEVKKVTDDITKGQEAIVRQIIDEKFSAWKVHLDKSAAEIANTAIVHAESNRTPIWKFWQRKDSFGVFVVSFITVIAFVADRTSGQAYLSTLLHEIIATDDFVNRQISNQNTKAYHSVSKIISDQIDLSKSSSSFHAAISDFVGNYIANTDVPDHPIPKAIRRVVGHRPILIFQGETVFGQAATVDVEFPGCSEFSRYMEEYSLTRDDFHPPILDCNLSGTVVGSEDFSIPFYATFWQPSGKSGHDVHLILSLVRIPADLNNLQTYASPHRYSVAGIKVKYLRTLDITGSPIEVELTGNLLHRDGTFFHADVSEIARSNFPFAPGLDLEQTFLHTIEISSDELTFGSLDEIIVAKALVFVNRMPYYAE
jgi:hypothetical protein